MADTGVPPYLQSHWFLDPLVPKWLLFLQQCQPIRGFLVIRVVVAISRPGAVVVVAGTASGFPKLVGSSLGYQNLVSWKWAMKHEMMALAEIAETGEEHPALA